MQSSSISPRSRRCRKAAVSLLALTTTCTTCAAPFLEAQTLLGSHESLLRQNQEAREHDFTYLRTTADVRDYAQQGLLVRLAGSSDYELADNVSFPYARPEVKTFVERLSDQYRSACGERLVVTSLTRPITRQPANASAISVHPTGMAIDLRRSDSSGCRLWLETVLLDLENKGVIEATREQYPPHYHVAVFPNPYLQYVASGEALPDIQVAKSTHETASRARVTRARSSRISRAKSSRVSRAKVAKASKGRATRAKVAKISKSRSARSKTVVAASRHRSSSRVATAKHVTSAKKSRVVRAATKRRAAPRQRVVVTRSKAASRHSKTSTARAK
jgi:hypothetical protein